jgi:hypothetical protein
MAKIKKVNIYLFVLFSISLLLSCGKGKKSEFGGRTDSVNGNVEIYKVNSSKWEKLNTSSKIEFGDSIKTDTLSEVQVRFAESNTIKIGENSKVVVTVVKDSNESNTIEVYNAFGTVLSNIPELTDAYPQYRVRTPTAVADVKGTFFWVAFRRRTRTTHINVLSGRVRVFNPRFRKRAPVIIMPGFFSFIVWGSPPCHPKKLNYGQWKKMHRIMPPGHYKKYSHKFKIKKPHRLKPGHKGLKFKKKGPPHKIKPHRHKPFKHTIKKPKKTTGKINKPKGLHQGKKFKKLPGGKGKGKKK